MHGDREKYLAQGMDGYIPKPIEQRDLLAEIARLLGQSRPGQGDGAAGQASRRHLNQHRSAR
jgi:DNA-binding response OmpR family regulator